MNIDGIIKTMTIIDGHSDIPRDVYLKELNGEHEVFSNSHYKQLKSAGVNIVFANAFSKATDQSAVKETLLQFQKMIDASQHNQNIVIIRSKHDLHHVIEYGKLGIILSIEGFEPLNNAINLLEIYYSLGLRAGMLTWNHANTFASGADHDEGHITQPGQIALRKMNQLGILVDVSHLNEKGFWDVIELNKHVTIASHSNARALFNHKRNLTDDQIKAIANSGGVVGCVSYFSKVSSDGSNPIRHEDDITESIDDYIKHIEYLVELVGYDHVGFGFDFNEYLGDFGVIGLENADRIKDVISKLLARNHTLENVSKIAGGNLLRVLEQTL